MPPLLHRPGSRKVEELGAAESGLPLGCDLERGYRQTDVHLEPGDTVLLYTDGITEAMDTGGAVYGLATLRGSVGRAPNDAEKLCLAVLNDVNRFTRGRTQSDDICMVCFSRKAST